MVEHQNVTLESPRQFCRKIRGPATSEPEETLQVIKEAFDISDVVFIYDPLHVRIADVVSIPRVSFATSKSLHTTAGVYMRSYKQSFVDKSPWP